MNYKIKPEDVSQSILELAMERFEEAYWNRVTPQNVADFLLDCIDAGVVSPPCHVKRHLGDMQPPFEGPTERIEPILDPDRLMATARWFLNNSYKDTHEIIAYLIACHCGDSREAKPYKLKGGGDE